MEEGVDEDDNEKSKSSSSLSVCSYGISINTSDIATVAHEDRGDELHSLDVDVYEQEKFESGILSQVDHALVSAETEFKRNAIRKELVKLQYEKRYLF